MELKNFDALVLVHPDLDTIHNPIPFHFNYRENLEKYIKLFLSLNKKIFAPDPDWLSTSLNKLNPEYFVPKFKEDFRIDLTHQKQIDFISEKINKKPPQIILAFGGLWANACVYAYATSWCKEVITDYLGDFKVPRYPPNPIKLGVVLNDIV
ncbi:MAG: hypothetical protein ACOYT4_05045 [Nanoarchaeota archaeon]